jgi:MoxR-like ATPase
VTDPTVDEVIEVARTYRNVVLEGPPGTGKTHLVGQVAARWEKLTGRPLGGDARGGWALTFHPSTGYEDFVEGVRANEKGDFRLREGFLRRCVRVARQHPERDFLVLLDELNRANVPRVLGDALLAVEASKRLRHDGTDWTGGLEVTLPYSQMPFGIPDNLYFLATMNTTDRSVASLDSALRRRFAFVRLSPLESDALLEALPEAARATLEPSVRTFGQLNEHRLQQVLGADSALGHSYLFDAAAALGEPDSTSGLAQELRDRTTADGVAFTEGFWLETLKVTSGSGHQLDLPCNHSGVTPVTAVTADGVSA